MEILKSIQKQWLGILLIIVYCLSNLLNEKNESALTLENKKLTVEISSLKKESVKTGHLIDSLKNVDVVYVDKIKKIKETVVKEIHILDSLPHSGVEKYFADRYNSKDSVTFYPENVAKATAKDLVNYDACKQISAEQENRINNFLSKDKLYEKQIGIKDTIISKQEVIIGNQKSIINSFKGPKFHTVLGVKTHETTLTSPNIYARAFLDVKKFSFGAQYNIQPTKSDVYNLIFEYKLF